MNMGMVLFNAGDAEVARRPGNIARFARNFFRGPRAYLRVPRVKSPNSR